MVVAVVPLSVRVWPVGMVMVLPVGTLVVLLTDIDGVHDGGGGLLTSLTAAEVHRLIAEGAISGGMIPKVACGLDALREGVRKVHIVDGRLEHAMLLEIFTDQGIGTEIVAAG